MAELTAGQYTVATDGTHINTDGVKRYVALLNQSGTDAPVITELENSLGEVPSFTYDDVGNYRLVAGTAPFTADKTVILIGASPQPTGFTSPFGWTSASRIDTTAVAVQTGNLDVAGQNVFANGLLTAVAIMILIYP